MKTAVDWLIEMISYSNKDTHFAMNESGFFDQAKELEKEQIINAHINGQSEFDMLQFRDINKTLSDNYYNKTYNQNK